MKTKLIIGGVAFLFCFVVAISAQTISWVYLGKSSSTTSLYVDVAGAKFSGDSVSFQGKVDQTTVFSANCKTHEFTALKDGKPTEKAIAPKGSYVELAIETVCGKDE